MRIDVAGRSTVDGTVCKENEKYTDRCNDWKLQTAQRQKGIHNNERLAKRKKEANVWVVKRTLARHIAAPNADTNKYTIGFLGLKR